MKRLRIFWKIIKFCYADRITLIYFLTLGASVFLLKLTDPAFNSLSSCVWYLYSVITTSGFGDVIPETVVGKIITIIVGLFSLVMVGLITGVVVNYFTEVAKAKYNESITKFIDQLEHLPELSKEELQEISDRVKSKKEQIKSNSKTKHLIDKQRYIK